MSKFNNTKNKISKLWQSSIDLTNQLDKNLNEIKKFFTEQNFFKSVKNIYNSDWIAANTYGQPLNFNVTQGELLAETVALNKEIDLEIPDYFLPFLEISVLTKTPPNVTSTAILEWNSEGYEPDYFEVRGDDNLIYKGAPHPRYYNYPQSALDNGDFQEDYATRIYSASIQYIFGGALYKVSGTLISVFLRKNLGTICENPDYDEWRAGIDPDYTIWLSSFSNFHSITADTIDYTAQKREVRDTTNPTPPPNCFSSVVDDDNGGIGHRVTKDFADMDRQYFRMNTATRYKWNGSSWQTVATGTLTVDTELGMVVTLRTFTFLGYWIFYSPDKRFGFGIINTNIIPVHEGINIKKMLYYLPEKWQYIDLRPWDIITFKRNPGSKPNKIVVPSITSSDQNHLFFKLSDVVDSLNRKKYKLLLKGTLVFSEPSIITNPPPFTKTNGDNREVVEYNDIYHKDPTPWTSSYSPTYIPTESHTLKNRNYYGGQHLDVQYQIQVNLINPFYYKEVRKYSV